MPPDFATSVFASFLDHLWIHSTAELAILYGLISNQAQYLHFYPSSIKEKKNTKQNKNKTKTKPFAKIIHKENLTHDLPPGWLMGLLSNLECIPQISKYDSSSKYHYSACDKTMFTFFNDTAWPLSSTSANQAFSLVQGQ